MDEHPVGIDDVESLRESVSRRGIGPDELLELARASGERFVLVIIGAYFLERAEHRRLRDQVRRLLVAMRALKQRDHAASPAIGQTVAKVLARLERLVPTRRSRSTRELVEDLFTRAEVRAPTHDEAFDRLARGSK